MLENRAVPSFAIGVSVLLHLCLMWQVLRLVIDEAPLPKPVAITLIREVLRPPPPKPLPKVKHLKPLLTPALIKPVVVPIKNAAPHPAPRVKPVERPHRHSPAKQITQSPVKRGPPVFHFRAAASDDGLDMDLGPANAGSGNGRDLIGDFDDGVKHRIEIAKTYPPGIPGVPNECIVEYRVTIDQKGQLLDYKLNGCGNPFLDSASRAAILKAGPFPVPPDFGAKQYYVYGSLIFWHR